MKYIARKNHRSFNEQMQYLASQCIEEFEEGQGVIPVPEDAEITE